MIKVNQTKFIDSTKLGSIDTDALPNQAIEGALKTEFRSCIGSL